MAARQKATYVIKGLEPSGLKHHDHPRMMPSPVPSGSSHVGITPLFSGSSVIGRGYFFPKGTDFSKVSPAELEAVVLKINQRPRKCLNYRAPYDVFADALRGALVT